MEMADLYISTVLLSALTFVLGGIVGRRRERRRLLKSPEYINLKVHQHHAHQR